jgi:anion-transporting  ArsA/GET3 family ATPase
MAAGKMYELTTWRSNSQDAEARRRPKYDLVVVDAPPTGQVLGMLGSARSYRGIIRGGRPAQQLVSIDRLFRQESRIALVTTPEDLAVAETLETVEALREGGFPAPWIVANRVRPPAFPKGTRAAGMRLSPKRLADVMRGAGADLDDEAAGQLLTAAREEEARFEAERRQLRRLTGAARPEAELPLLATESFGRPEVEHLAGCLGGPPA